MQMGQFLDHDFAHSPFNPQITCCDENIENRHEQCIPIEFGDLNDSFFSNLDTPVTCHRLSRTLASPNLRCELDMEKQQVMLYSFTVF